MKARICSARVRSWASISGTVSGIGTGISAGSTVEDRSGTAVGAAATTGAAVDAGTGITLVIVVDGATFGSFENASKLKSKRLPRSPGLKATFAYICAERLLADRGLQVPSASRQRD